MDLTRLYNLTTPELRQEAERLGVRDTYAMSRGQLIHAIRDQVDGPPAEGLLGKVLGFARWALQAAQEEPPSRAAASVAEPAAESVTESAAVPASATAPSPESEPEPVPAADSATAPVPVPVLQAAAATAQTPPAPSSPQDGGPRGPEPTASGPPSRPPVGVFSKSAGVFEEPFPTRTMARILADQGHFKRSLAIYATLLREEPADRELNAEIDDVRARSRGRRSHVH